MIYECVLSELELKVIGTNDREKFNEITEPIRKYIRKCVENECFTEYSKWVKCYNKIQEQFNI